jgi:hypothetical protein
MVLMMDHNKLRADLEKLHKELREIESVDLRERELLRLLDSDFQTILSKSGGSLQPDNETGRRLGQALARIEAAHPRIMLMTRQMVDTLAYLGV